jgi:hypothetical protein
MNRSCCIVLHVKKVQYRLYTTGSAIVKIKGKRSIWKNAPLGLSPEFRGVARQDQAPKGLSLGKNSQTGKAKNTDAGRAESDCRVTSETSGR